MCSIWRAPGVELAHVTAAARRADVAAGRLKQVLPKLFQQSNIVQDT
jgi:hypothetical protein